MRLIDDLLGRGEAPGDVDLWVPAYATSAEVVSRVWAYIKEHDLQNPENRREILADAKLEPIFGKKKVTMFEMNKHLARHLT